MIVSHCCSRKMWLALRAVTGPVQVSRRNQVLLVLYPTSQTIYNTKALYATQEESCYPIGWLFLLCQQGHVTCMQSSSRKNWLHNFILMQINAVSTLPQCPQQNRTRWWLLQPSPHDLRVTSRSQDLISNPSSWRCPAAVIVRMELVGGRCPPEEGIEVIPYAHP